MGTLGACTSDGGTVDVVLVPEPPASTVLPGQDPAGTAVALSRALFDSAYVAVVVAEDSPQQLPARAAEAGLPALVGTGEPVAEELSRLGARTVIDRKSTRLNSSHVAISYAVFCLKKTKQTDSRRS